MVLFDRIKFDGLRGRDWIIFKYPLENIRLGSKLIVNEGQVAIIVKGGQVCDYFTAGTYTLSTENLPIVGKLLNFFFNNKTPLTTEIFFINLTNKLDLYWGTSDPIQLIDPKYNVKLRIRAFGQLALRINDYTLFFQELIGSMHPHEIVQFDKVIEYFRGMIVTYIKSELANKIIREKISALEISAELMNISNELFDLAKIEFDQFGLELVSLRVQSINFPEEDFVSINKILSDKAKFEIMGDNRYITQRSFDVFESAIENSNGVAGAFTNSTIRSGAGQAALQSMPQQLNDIHQQSTVVCPSCHEQASPLSKFCHLCGHSFLQKAIPCTNCQHENQESAKFCAGCGKNLQSNICSCGSKLSTDAKFCNNCGEKI